MGKRMEQPLPPPHRRSLRGILKPRPKKPIRDWREAQEAIEAAIAEEFEKRMREAAET